MNEDLSERKRKASEGYREKFEEESSDFFSSSGRMEILGNHTDHNHGQVLVGAVNLDLLAATSKTDTSVITIISEGYGKTVVSLHHLARIEDEKGTVTALIKGVVTRMKKNGYNVGGFRAYINSILPSGTGISSSAAFECLVAEILNYYYNHDAVDPYQIARVAQYAEKEYFGKPCGLLDQCGVAFGGINKINFKTLNNPKITHLETNFGPYEIVLTNTGGDHSSLTEHYAAIPQEMKEVASFFKKRYLSQISFKTFQKALPELRKNVSDRAILRAYHFYNENEIVKKGYKYLEKGNLKKFIECVRKSGESSYMYLQNTCVPGSNEQNINLALTISKFNIKDGACRVHGGGFEGTVLAFVNKNEVDNYVSIMQSVFGKDNVYHISLRNKGTMHL